MIEIPIVRHGSFAFGKTLRMIAR